jgi:2-polyprenyl-3-methyl-5-hydroxy-6-metoxy-1,4-benzoquinol methylase
MQTVDRAIRALARRLGPTRGNRILSECRRRALAEVLAWARPEATVLAPRLDAGDAAARDALSRLAERALVDMRQRADNHADGSLAPTISAADAWWRSVTAGEHIDDPNLDEGLRRQAMEDLDSLNRVLGTYPAFLDMPGPLMKTDRPTRLLDLAAGHGGFAIALARDARQRGLALRITATDLKQEYLDLGAERARAEGLAVEFAKQDALDLSNLLPGDYDLVICTQSIHHFPPGLVAIMFEAAARVAGRGVVFIDGCRSLTRAAPLVAFVLLRFRNPVIAHDAYVSFRRFFVPEELALLARLGPWGDGAVATWAAPDHCLLRLDKAARSATDFATT